MRHKELIERADSLAGGDDCLIRLLAAALRELSAENKMLKQQWERDCQDTDLLLQSLGLCPSEYRSEGGSLLLGRISHKLKTENAALRQLIREVREDAKYFGMPTDRIDAAMEGGE